MVYDMFRDVEKYGHLVLVSNSEKGMDDTTHSKMPRIWMGRIHDSIREEERCLVRIYPDIHPVGLIRVLRISWKNEKQEIPDGSEDFKDENNGKFAAPG